LLARERLLPAHRRPVGTHDRREVEPARRRIGGTAAGAQLRISKEPKEREYERTSSASFLDPPLATRVRAYALLTRLASIEWRVGVGLPRNPGDTD
jgi:hypothetical protein